MTQLVAEPSTPSCVVGGMAPVVGTTTGDGVRPATSLDTRLRLLYNEFTPESNCERRAQLHSLLRKVGSRGMREGESKHFLTDPRL